MPSPESPQSSSASSAPGLRVACIGGGPGGLFAAIAMAREVPGATVDVYERNRASDVFGFGVVFSDATLDNVDKIDPVLRDALAEDGRHWDSIEVRSRGVNISAGGNGMSAIHRKVLLHALHNRATELGARLHFSEYVTVDELVERGDHDLIIAADGSNSAVREQFIDDLGHSVDIAAVKFIWFGTTFDFDGLTFLHKKSEHGNFAVHAYPIGSGLSTFIVETNEPTWRRAGLDEFDTSQPPGTSDDRSQKYLENLFAEEIDGHSLVANNSRWANFRTRRTQTWATRAGASTPVVLIGDAVHTAHFSVGSGTKMAMEDAAVLAQSIAKHPDNLAQAITEFGEIRRPQVARIQDASLPSLSWWDHFGEYHDALAPWQFGFHFFTRAISSQKIGARDPRFVADAHAAWAADHGQEPVRTPLAIGSIQLTGRLLAAHDVSPDEVTLTDGTSSLTATADPTPGELALFTAPETDTTSLERQDLARLEELMTSGPIGVAVRGGTALTRVLCSEYLRLHHHVAVIVIEPPEAVRSRRAVDPEDSATTLVMSGRADAVAFEAVSPASDSSFAVAGAVR